MIVVEVRLHSAIDGRVEKLGEMVINNDGTGTPDKGNYEARVFRKPKFFNWRSLKDNVTRKGSVKDYARKRRVIWDLVTLALKDMGYGK